MASRKNLRTNGLVYRLRTILRETFAKEQSTTLVRESAFELLRALHAIDAAMESRTGFPSVYPDDIEALDTETRGARATEVSLSKHETAKL